ncbi:MAG: helix-turn-helix domain-containing protein [Clostridium sp.]|nr:helix-turn-helix domain-containing protein [Clostridium sp.]
MRETNSYPNIDLEKTGIHLKNLITQQGYTVKDIQDVLRLSCPQPVYRWFKGQILPSVDHLYVLSRLLCVHMEELLISSQMEISFQKEILSQKEVLPQKEALLQEGILPQQEIPPQKEIVLFELWGSLFNKKAREKRGRVFLHVGASLQKAKFCQKQYLIKS